MANKISAIPEFTPEETSQPAPQVITGQEEVKEAVEAPTVEEKETPVEPPATREPASEPSGDTGAELQREVARATEGLRNEIVDLRRRLAAATGHERTVIKQDIALAQQQMDELKDVHPEDVALIERVLRSRGYVPKAEIDKTLYKNVQDEELNKFLDRYPEYKPENDPDNINWERLQKELGFYRMPDDPHLVGSVLERAHRASAGTSSDRTIPIKQHQAQVASVGSGGVQRSSSRKNLDPRLKIMMEDGGFTADDIRRAEERLSSK